MCLIERGKVSECVRRGADAARAAKEQKRLARGLRQGQLLDQVRYESRGFLSVVTRTIERPVTWG